MTDQIDHAAIYTAPTAVAQIDPLLLVAEMRAAELLACLQAAVAGDRGWRMRAQMLLRSLAAAELPKRMSDQLREIEARKRTAESMEPPPR